MIEWLINRIFSWNKLREAIFSEVHFYDKIDEALNDTTPGSLFWEESGGWKCWTYSKERNKYYFNDIPEKSLVDAMVYTFESKGPELDLTEEW